jgi:PAS domain S-box-containing protein
MADPSQGKTGVSSPAAAGGDRTVLDGLLEGCMVIGSDWTYLYVNEAAALHGRKRREELEGRTMLEAYPGIESTAIFARYRRCMEGRTPDRFESPYTFEDGVTHWYDFHVSPVPEGIFVLSMDVTEKVEAEAALRASEEKYRQIVETTHDGVWTIDAESRTVFVNRRMAELLGYEPEEMNGRPLFSFLSDDTRDDVEVRLEHHRQGVSESFERCFVRKDGSGIWTLVSTSPLPSPDGRYNGALAIVTDISERKRAAEAVLDRQRFLAGLIENSGALVFVKDREGRYELVNRKWREATGIGGGTAIGRTDAELFPPEVARRFRENDLAAMASCREVESEEFLDDPEGRRLFHSVKFPVWNEDGTVRGTCGITTESTARWAALNALHDSEERLREVLENSLYASYKRDLRTNRYLYFSPVFVRLTGYTAAEMIALPLEEAVALIHPDDVPGVERVLADALAGPAGTPFEALYRFRHRTGTWVWLEDRFTVLRGPEGRAVALIGSVAEVTRWKTAEDELRALKAEREGRGPGPARQR